MEVEAEEEVEISLILKLKNTGFQIFKHENK